MPLFANAPIKRELPDNWRRDAKKDRDTLFARVPLTFIAEIGALFPPQQIAYTFTCPRANFTFTSTFIQLPNSNWRLFLNRFLINFSNRFSNLIDFYRLFRNLTHFWHILLFFLRNLLEKCMFV